MSRGVDENSKQPTWREKFSGLVLFAADCLKTGATSLNQSGSVMK